MIDTHETVASKQSRYRRLMRKAESLDDPILVRLIRQKMTTNGQNGYEAATDKGAIIQFPGLPVSAETIDCNPLMLKSSEFKLNKDRSKLLTFYCMAAIVFVFMFVSLVRFYNPDVFLGKHKISLYQPANVATSIDYCRPYAPELSVFAGTCALLLVGNMFWVFYRQFKKDNQISRNAMENSLYAISLETGWTEYELFRISARGWSVSGAKIDADFKLYMAHQILPYYVIDFVRKNHDNRDITLIKEKEIKPTSLRDLLVALLIFPGSILLPLLLPIFFHYGKPY